MAEREVIKIAVSPEAKQAIEAMCQRYGMSQIELASRLYTWLADQEEVVQAAVLGLLPEDLAPEIAELALRRMAEREGEGEAGPGAKKAAKPAKKPVHATRRVPQGKSAKRRGRRS